MLICTATTLIYVLGGIIDTHLMFYSITIDEITASIVSFVLYLVFLHATSHRHFLQLMCVYLVVHGIGIALGAALDLLLMPEVDDPFEDLISFTELGRNLLVCLLAYATWHATTRKWRTLEPGQ